jgi:hypothetical protein
MPVGGGKYDGFTTTIREATGADGVVLMVLGGVMGQGFSVQGTEKVVRALPEMLREIADQIEGDMADILP